MDSVYIKSIDSIHAKAPIPIIGLPPAFIVLSMCSHNSGFLNTISLTPSISPRPSSRQAILSKTAKLLLPPLLRLDKAFG
ncbi:hypothetical protein ACHAW5_008978 [Stephanodiscus triporus]|uniref:Uncharacterized protein n=1 Tax=Stephanodiscus triporus TaxID=2934178 RepID=A0ABD3PVR5_9STRA